MTYSQQYYDTRHKLVSFRFAPRSHSPPAIFFSRFVLSSASFPKEAFRIVQDFKTQLQYTISERTGNCSVGRITEAAPDAEVAATGEANKSRTNPGRVKVKHARDLLHIDPKKFVYSGQVRST